MISIIECIEQAENKSRSENIKWGIKQRAASGTSKLYDRKCDGYEDDVNGKLVIGEETIEKVRLIYDLYLQGRSIIHIICEVEKHKIASPTGKERWCKSTIDVMLSNEKYIGNVRLLKSRKGEVQYLASDNNPVIISLETFEAVQIEKVRRSNVTKDENGSPERIRNTVQRNR